MKVLFNRDIFPSKDSMIPEMGMSAPKKTIHTFGGRMRGNDAFLIISRKTKIPA